MRRSSRDNDLERVYREHLDAIFSFFSYSVARHVAEDLTATTFERVVKAWGRYDPSKASERTWILTIARNALTDHYRRQSHRKAASLDEHPGLADSLAQADPFAQPLAADAFAGWLRDLGDRDRQVLALKYGADLSAAEIAALLDLSEPNIHQIVSRALKRLRTKAHAADESGHDR
ncbi:MAG: sigma-70 family RNA polymerase sigma factor [Solirubrobacteraceae bacterium]|nr:sigma-70 family RNA polymerase sigma factor [Solirubrobacteraceae bacterium]